VLDHRAPTAALPELPERRAFERTGRSAVERLAVLAVARDVAAMPASLVVQLALWPDDLAHWARAERVSESLVYNTLAARKPYARVRQLLARRLDVPVGVVGQLIDARRPLPAVQREPGHPLVAPDAAVDWSTPPFPAQRDGGNPVERRAVRAVARGRGGDAGEHRRRPRDVAEPSPRGPAPAASRARRVATLAGSRAIRCETCSPVASACRRASSAS
jgi:hypothetical protein